LRDNYEQLDALGVGAVAIGLGAPESAASFKAEENIPFTLLVDSSRSTYKALGFKKGTLLDVLGPRVVTAGVRSILGGHKTVRPKEDPFQLGGAAVITPDGRITYQHRNATSADNVPMDELLDAAERAAATSP